MEYGIKKLPHGYLVSDSKEWIAAFSNFEDMAMWLSERFDIDETWDKAPDGWIDWKGGEPPAIADPIMVRFRDGSEHETNVRNMRWNHMDMSSDIVAYRVATPEPAVVDDGWTEWKGGPMPVSAHKIVEYRNRREHGIGRADSLRWDHYGETAGGDIVAYRVVTSEPIIVDDGWIEWFGGKEPDAQYVEVRFADGGVRKDRPGLFYGWDFNHPHSKENSGKRIVAYRVVTP